MDSNGLQKVRCGNKILNTYPLQLMTISFQTKTI